MGPRSMDESIIDLNLLKVRTSWIVPFNVLLINSGEIE